ncbi:MAG: hypothetical protein ACE5Q6_21300 [Dehalococcoidia bacterium]
MAETKLETLQAKLAKLQEDIEAEQRKEAVETARAEVRDTFAEAIKAAITITETDTGKSLRDIGLGIWLAYPPENTDGEIMVSALTVGDDGLPAALRRTASKNGSNGHSNGNGYLYQLADGRTFETCEMAVNALGTETRDANGDFLDGKQYYHRHDRLPKALKEKITKVEKPETPGDGDKE